MRCDFCEKSHERPITPTCVLTEATNDLTVVTEVIERNAMTGFSTRLYDAIELVIKARLNKIDGRKAIVLFTDGVDTASYQGTYQSTLREVEELDALIYPIQYDTTDFVDAQTRTNATIVTTTLSGRHFPTQSSSQVIYGTPKASGPGTSIGDYKLADQYLQQLATKTGGRLYKANARTQLSDAFSKIAEELRHQSSDNSAKRRASRYQGPRRPTECGCESSRQLCPTSSSEAIDVLR